MNGKKGTFLKILAGILIFLAFIQVFRPTRNLGNDNTNHIATRFAVPDSVEQILKTSCYDCHSNQTTYPWYTNVQPVGWWLQHHVNEGKDELNFSEFTTYRIFRQYHKMEETLELLRDDKMPLPSYIVVHTDAKLNENQKKLLSQWAVGIMDTLKANYPADSLRRPQRPRP